jgi:hypothetical protein
MQKARRGRVNDGLKLPGLAEALEVYRRVAELGGVLDQPPRAQVRNPAGRNA